MHQLGPAEAHKYKGGFYLFTTSHSDEIIEAISDRCEIPRRATQIYVDDTPCG